MRTPKAKAFRMLFSLFFFLFIFMIIFNSTSHNTSEETIADGFTIDSYNIKLDVQEDNKVNVTEDITVNWIDNNHHGIYKFIPQWLEYTSKTGKTIKRKATISNLISTTDSYTIDTVNGKDRIRLGDASTYVTLGQRTYNVSYTYDMGTDPFSGYDEFIFHAFGDFWGTEIKNASIEVTMPKDISSYNINFFTDKYRQNNVNKVMDYDISDNKITATFNASKYKNLQIEDYCRDKSHLNSDNTCNMDNFVFKSLTKSLTIDIELPDNYFTKGSDNYGIVSLLIIIVIIILMTYTIFKWLKYGKDYPKRSKTVEFYPPDNLNSAEIGYIYGNKSIKKLTISLMIMLASKGYIKINDLKDKDKKIEIVNLYPKPISPKELDSKTNKRSITIEKLKDYDNYLSSKAITMMKYLFKEENTKTIEANIQEFLNVREELIQGNYIKILSDNLEKNQEIIDLNKKQYLLNQEQYEKNLQNYNDAIKKAKPLSKLEQIVYDKLFEKENTIIVSEHKTLYQAFLDVETSLTTETEDLIMDKKATSECTNATIRLYFTIFLCVINYWVIADLNPKYNILYLISFLCLLAMTIFTIIMKRKTKYGEEIKARIDGFRDFLLTAEKERLEDLVTKNPEYFYDILPYTYVLNISKKWIKKFENIPMPQMDMGTFDYSSDSFYLSVFNDVSFPTASSGGSSGGGGGGCSSCGGGCSSCGGGGSW